VIISESIFISPSTNTDLIQYYIIYVVFEMLAVSICIAVKESDDCFHCFNRVQHLRYSDLAGILAKVGQIRVIESEDGAESKFSSH